MKFQNTIAAALVAFGFATTANAQQPVQNCLRLDNETARLACFDTMFGYVPRVKPVESKPAFNSEWNFVESKDAFSGNDTSFVSLDAKARSGRDVLNFLVVRCNGSGGTDIYAVSTGYLSNQRVRVQYRFGEDKPISERWSPSSKGDAAFLPGGYRDFRKGLNSGQPFVMEILDYNGSPHFGEFPAHAKDEKAEFVFGGCK